MIDATIKAEAPTPAAEVAEIEKAQKAETESTKPTGSEQEPSAFDKLAGKKGFKSVDDLVSAYSNLESTMNPTRKELRELKEMVKGIQDSTKPAEADPFSDLPKEQQEAMGLLNQLLDTQLKSKLSPLLQKLEVEEASKNIDKVRQQYPGLEDAELEQAMSVMEKYPKMSLDEAVKITSYDRATTSTRKATEKKTETKRAFTESAASARVGDTDYSKLTLKELEEMLDIPSSHR